MSADLKARATNAVERWFSVAIGTSKSKVGIPNTGLIVAEHLRLSFPLRESDYLSPSRGQVRGLSGKSADQIITRFRNDAPLMGTESGRTSRGTVDAARALAEILNDAFSGQELLSFEAKAWVADVVQQWIIDNPLTEFWSQRRLEVEYDSRWPLVHFIRLLINEARERGISGQVSQHLVGAKLAVRFPDREVPNHSYSTADLQTGRPGDFHIGDSAFHVTMTPSDLVIDKCRRTFDEGFRPILLVPDERRDAAAGIIKDRGLDDRIEVLGIESFVAQNIDEIGNFGATGVGAALRTLLEKYNERVAAVEPDPSVQVRIPDNLGKTSDG